MREIKPNAISTLYQISHSILMEKHWKEGQPTFVHFYHLKEKHREWLRSDKCTNRYWHILKGVNENGDFP